MEDVTYLSRTCPRCRKVLTDDAPEGLCAACLLAAATETLTGTIDDALTVTARGGAARRPVEGELLTAGQSWGPYRIGRLLGRGGMGEVHEAEHVETGRRIALKVLRSRLQDSDDRARFLREGQLAASISHPHTVYIFGSEEIAGVPVISMELLPGGTLKDRVTSEGPLAPSVAVSAVLDIIGGLDAAQAAGILHRDIKPSNCFVDSDGSVKVGDFGLSISTLARDVHQQLPTGFEGTPQFAAPEQLRGEPLDVRADIYAVGATLYYLLTGQPPFEARDLRELVDRVNHEPARSPRLLRREIPQGLAAVVLRCLEKSPADRPASYTAMADALRPFSALDERPAAPGIRLIACVVDILILAMPWSIWRMATADIASMQEQLTSPWTWLVNLVYFFALEARWGTTLGKRLFGLRLSPVGGASWLPRVMRRTIVFHLPWLIVSLLIVGFGPFGPTVDRRFGTNANFTLRAKDTRDLIEGVATLTLIACLFVTARRRNGWTALHDLVSVTRVVSGVPSRARKRSSSSSSATIAFPASTSTRYGPFVAQADGGVSDGGRLLIGFDPVLRRSVWIHEVPRDTPPIETGRRDVSRTGRLHWLSGRRSAAENWDAYEAPDGRPLLTLDHTARQWSTVKSWLLDLASELTASKTDDSTPPLGLDRVWARDDGRLLLLDFPAPGLDPARAPAPADLTPVQLLSSVASHALPRGSRSPLMPLSAHAMLTHWSRPAPPALVEARADLERVSVAQDRVSRARRALPIVLPAFPLVSMIAFMTLVAIPTMNRFFGPEPMQMLGLLEQLYNQNPPAGSRMADPEVRRAVEIYLAGHHGERLKDPEFWASPLMRAMNERLGAIARDVSARHPSVSAEELSRASVVLAPELERRRQKPEQNLLALSGLIINVVSALMLLLLLGISVLSSVIVPGGIFTRLLGHGVIRRNGTEIGRMLSLVRTLVAWAPVIAWLVYLAASPKVQGFVPVPPNPLLGMSLAVGAMAIGAALTIARPSRSPHDWLLGTWLVPR